MPEHLTTSTTPSTPAVTAPARFRRPWLWALLTVAVVLNVLASAGALPLAVGIVAGLVTLGCAATLVVPRVRRR